MCNKVLIHIHMLDIYLLHTCSIMCYYSVIKALPMVALDMITLIGMIMMIMESLFHTYIYQYIYKYNSDLKKSV